MFKILLIAQVLVASLDTGMFSVKVSTTTLSDSTTVKVNPLPITRFIASLGGNDKCSMFMFRDSSFVMRTIALTDTSCVRRYNIIPEQYRKSSGYYQKRVDQICILQESRDASCVGTFEIFQSFSNGWPQCTPYVNACGASTTVMDYNAESKERYENGPYWCASRNSYGPLLSLSDCYWSGWEYPLNGFPGRWETADNWIFFLRR